MPAQTGQKIVFWRHRNSINNSSRDDCNFSDNQLKHVALEFPRATVTALNISLTERYPIHGNRNPLKSQTCVDYITL